MKVSEIIVCCLEYEIENMFRILLTFKKVLILNNFNIWKIYTVSFACKI